MAVVDRYRGIPPYIETQKYVRRVITRFNTEKTKKLCIELSYSGKPITAETFTLTVTFTATNTKK